METLLTHCKAPPVFETVVDMAVIQAPVKLVTTASALQQKQQQKQQQQQPQQPQQPVTIVTTAASLQQPQQAQQQQQHPQQQQQQNRKSSFTLTVDKTEHLLGAALNALRQLASQQQLCTTIDSTNRREQLQNKKVLVVCCGHDGLDSKKPAFEFIQQLGIRCFLVEDGKNTLALFMEKSKIVEQLIRVSMTPRESLLEDVMDAVLRVSDLIGGFDGVCTLWDDAVSLCARIAERLSLPGNSVRSVDISHNKHLTREAMRKVGLATPSSCLVKSESDLPTAAEAVGFPAILKPMYGASSLAVIKVDELDSLKSTYHRVLDMLKHFYEEGELMGLTFNENGLSDSFKESSLSWLVMEEFLDGDEVDVDLVLRDGKAVYQCVVDDWPQIQPWFAEMGNNCPSKLPSSVQQELISMAFNTATKAMGFRDGVFHCELKNTTKGPRIIEVNPRMGGGPVWSLHKVAYGLDLVEETLYSALSIQGSPDIPKLPRRYVSCGEKFFDNSIIVPEAFCRVVEAMRLFPNVLEATPLVETGERIVGIRDGFPTRAARFIVYGESAMEVETYAQKLLDMCDIPQVLRAAESNCNKI